jgi:hypothetical protein
MRNPFRKLHRCNHLWVHKQGMNPGWRQCQICRRMCCPQFDSPAELEQAYDLTPGTFMLAQKIQTVIDAKSEYEWVRGADLHGCDIYVTAFGAVTMKFHVTPEDGVEGEPL